MVKRILLVAVIVVLFAGCVQYQQQEEQTTPTFTSSPTPHQEPIVTPTTFTPTPRPTPNSTPPPPVAGFCNAARPISDFVEGYNTRNASKIVEAFNATVMNDHSIKGIREELEFAEEYEVFIIGMETGEISDVPLGKSAVVLSINGKKVRPSIDFSFQCFHHTATSGVYDRVIQPEVEMTSWPFDDFIEVVEKANVSASAPNTSEQEVVKEFFEHYNHRNATGIYSLYSEMVREEHSLSEVERMLGHAETAALDIEYEEKNNETMVVNVSTVDIESISGFEKLNGTTGYQHLNLSLDYKESRPKIDSWIYFI